VIRTGQEKRSVVVGGGGGGGRRRRRKEDNQELGQECLTRACGSGSERCCVELCQLARLGRVDVAVWVRCGDGSGVRVVLCIPVLPGKGGDHGIHENIYIYIAGKLVLV